MPNIYNLPVCYPINKSINADQVNIIRDYEVMVRKDPEKYKEILKITGGFCYALSIAWLCEMIDASRKPGEFDHENKKLFSFNRYCSDNLQTYTLTLMDYFNKYVKSFNHAKERVADGDYALFINEGEPDYYDDTFVSEIAKSLKKSIKVERTIHFDDYRSFNCDEGFWMCGIKRAGGNHMMGIVRRNGYYYLYDPNDNYSVRFTQDINYIFQEIIRVYQSVNKFHMSKLIEFT